MLSYVEVFLLETILCSTLVVSFMLSNGNRVLRLLIEIEMNIFTV